MRVGVPALGVAPEVEADVDRHVLTPLVTALSTSGHASFPVTVRVFRLHDRGRRAFCPRSVVGERWAPSLSDRIDPSESEEPAMHYDMRKVFAASDDVGKMWGRLCCQIPMSCRNVPCAGLSGGGGGARTPEPLDCQSSALPTELRPRVTVKLSPPWSEAVKSDSPCVFSQSCGSDWQPFCNRWHIHHSGSLAEDNPGHLVRCAAWST